MLSEIKKTAFRQFKKSEVRLHELNYLFWECTMKCNLACLHCGSDCSKSNSAPDMPLKDFLSALDTIENPSRNFIVVLTGGEPLLRNDIELCGREIRKRGMRWSLVTNGYLYDKERHISLLNAGLGALTVSLDGMEISHNWLRGSDSSFRNTVKAIDIASGSSRLNFDIVTCVNKRNLYELNEMLEFLILHHVKAWRLFTIVGIGRAKENPDLFLSDVQFMELMTFISESRKKRLIDIKFSCEGFVGDYELKVRDSYFFCRAGINISSILNDGSISACPNIDRAFTQGNIYEDNFFDVWQNRYDSFRNKSWTKTGICSSCSDYRDCEGNGFHNWHGEPKSLLICHKELLENAIRHQHHG
jgi:radical SAM enzyme (rSAM/lipoprotein system)